MAHRVFDPQTLLPYWNRDEVVDPNDVAVYSRYLKHYQMLTRLNGEDVYSKSIMVFVDGACLDNGSPNAQAGYGVYFGDDSPHSISKAVNPCEPQTNQRAEIHAAIAALYQIRRLIDFRNGNLTKIILVTDSAYVARSMSEYILKWRENDYTNSRGSDVVNRDLFKRLDGLIIELEDGNRRQVQFWKIPRCWNSDADELARDAAEGCC